MNVPVERSNKTRLVLSHRIQAADRYIINTHALHNAHLLRETLPRYLMKPTLRFPDRTDKHHEFAAMMRVIGPARRAAAQEKGRITRERRKAAANPLPRVGGNVEEPGLKGSGDEEMDEGTH